INAEFHIGCDLSVVEMQGWKRHMYYADTGLAWIPPSPNLPTPVSAMVYPGQVLWEGTNVSEGRGTTQPFELFGAPWMDTNVLENALGKAPFSGAVLRPAVFEPTSGKWAGRSCQGFQIHVTDRQQYLPYQTTLALAGVIRKLFGNEFAWKMPPYEYEWEKLPFDLITGDAKIRVQLEAGADAAEMALHWQPQLEAYQQWIRPYLLYE
ncbi:MAG: exo-beta-N-acetylmuramidase NamZ domain-containing protein, partial [Desulfosalsimonas sp.]